MTDGHRLHPLALIPVALRLAGRGWPLLIVALFQSDQFPLVALFLGALPVLGVIAVLQWWRFRYAIDGDTVRLERGIFVRREVTIPRDRIQSVDTKAGLVQRMLNLVELDISTESSSLALRLPGLRREEAERIRAWVEVVVDVSSDDPAAIRATPRWSVDTRRLLAAASTSGRLGLVLPAVAWVAEQLRSTGVDLAERSEFAAVADAVPAWLGIGLGVLVLLILAWVVAFVIEFLSYSGFTIERDGNALRVSRGLFERREITLPIARIQAVHLEEGLLRQPWGFVRLKADTSGNPGERGESLVLHPLLRRDEVPEALRQLLPGYAVDPPLRRPPRRALRRFVLPGLFVVGLAAAGAWWWLDRPVWVGWGGGVALLAVAILSWLRARDTGWFAGSRVVSVQQRTWLATRITSVVKRSRIQAFSWRQNWFQRRARLATAGLTVASGVGGRRLDAPHLDAADVAGWASAEVDARLQDE